MKSRGPKGLQLEVGARRAPRLLVKNIRKPSYIRNIRKRSYIKNILSRSKLVIHEVDEPPLGVPGELHFDDEEEEVERGGLTSIHLN